MMRLPAPYYDRDGITIFCGDALQIAPLLYQGGHQPVMFCTDWPYRITPGSNSTDRMHGGIWDPAIYDNSGDMFPTLRLQAKTLRPLIRCLASNSDLYLMTNDKHLHAGLNAYRGNRIGLHNVLMWHRGTKTPNKWGMKDTEFILYGWQGHARNWNDMGMGTRFHDAPPPQQIKAHPTQKPLSLLRRFIEQSTDPGALCFDPFMGSGSFLVAARDAGRKAIGIELLEAHCASAVRWLETGVPLELAQVSMFQ